MSRGQVDTAQTRTQQHTALEAEGQAGWERGARGTVRAFACLSSVYEYSYTA
jgi:hypothetical protein